MNSNEKLKRLLEMQEHPERYTDEEIRQLMADEECRQLYEQMVRATDALYSDKTKEKRKDSTIHYSLKKIAAMFIGVLMIAGVTFATVHIMRRSGGGISKSPIQEMRMSATSQHKDTLEVDSAVVTSPVIFEDAELAAILGEISAFYQVQTVYQKEESKHIRLYFTWDKQSSIDDVIDTFNKFERIHITRDDKKLIVE